MFCVENDLTVNVGKTEAMFVHCDGQMYVDGKKIATVKEFKYLGLIISNSRCKPDVLL
jgi:hypothetical protein